MTLKRNLLGSGALWILTSGLAVADVTAADVWADWQSIMASYGDTVDFGQTNTAGDVTTIKGASIEGNLEAGSYTIKVPTITMTDMSNGTVSIKVGDVSKVTAVFPTETGRDGQIVTTINTTNYNMTASGSADELVYDYIIDEVRVFADELKMGNITMSFVAEMMMQGVSGKSIVAPGPLRKVTQSFAADMMTGEVDVEDPSGEGGGKMSFDIPNISSTTTANMPEGINLMDAEALRGNGYSVDGTFAYSALDFDLDVQNEDGSVAFATTNQGGSTSVFSDDTAVEMAFASQGTKMEIGTDQFPFPISLSAANQDSKLRMPIAQTETPEKFLVEYTLADFEMNDALWGLFDPMRQLPRDPATVSFDIEGAGKLDVDLTDPDVDVPMGELESLTLNSLLVDVVGAQLTGTGAFTFDNSDTTTFGGVPKPTGQIDLNLLGINGLMDTLATMGLLPAEQAMGARMMMGIFARPGDGPDSLTSKIEINAAGQVLANGQRIR
jgi:hypothetical protein